jgi:hypothetical protein
LVPTTLPYVPIKDLTTFHLSNNNLTIHILYYKKFKLDLQKTKTMKINFNHWMAVIALSFFSLQLTAQLQTSHFEGVPLQGNFQKPLHSTMRAPGEFFVDYDYSDEDYSTNTLGILYSRYIWRMNMRYELTQGDTSIKFVVVDYNTLVDSYGNILGNPGDVYPYSSFTGLKIDSVYVACGHMNQSGMNDTLMCKIIALNGTGYPQTGTVLNTTQIIQNTSFTGQATWLQGGVIGFAPNYTLAPAQTFGVMIEYYGAKQDTFGILAGFPDQGSGLCAAIPQLQNFAELSYYAPNSYRQDMRFAPPLNSFPLLPASSGADTYYDCNGQTGFQAGQDSRNFIQNWTIWVKLSYTNTTASVNENDMNLVALSQNIPNPANGNTIINYQLAAASTVNFEVVDITGKLVYSQNMGMKNAGNHSINIDASVLAPGAYFYSLTVGNYKTTKKMIVNR